MAHELILIFSFETPPRANEFGELFSALARDYRDLTRGRSLVIADVEHGSIIFKLIDAAIAAVPHIKDAVAVAHAVKGIADLVKAIKSFLGKENSGDSAKRLPRRGKKKPGARSA